MNDLLTPILMPLQRAKRVNDLLNPTLLPIQKSQEGEKLIHSQTDAYTEEQRV